MLRDKTIGVADFNFRPSVEKLMPQQLGIMPLFFLTHKYTTYILIVNLKLYKIYIPIQIESSCMWTQH